MKKLSVLIIAMLLGFVACGGGVQYQDASKAEGSREWGPKEIKMTVNKMVESMYKFLKEEWKKPAFIEVKQIRNKTSEHIDTQMLADEITTNLIKRRIKFIDQSLTADAIAEMEKGMTGMVDPESAIPVGELKSPNMYLTGEVRENVRTVGSKSVQYLVVTLKLINLKTQVVEWQDQQEFLKSASKKKITF
ncbi:MAG: hypothetical protein GYA16_04375 [Spirochaetes bacterium]|nr:hypothetical protein [Spirochaetota bacterium]